MGGVNDIGGVTAVVLYTAGAGLGAWLAGGLFGCKLKLPIAFGLAFVASLFYLIPTVGFAIAFLVMVIGIRQMSELGDWQEAAMTAVGANGVAFVAGLLWVVGN